MGWASSDSRISKRDPNLKKEQFGLLNTKPRQLKLHLRRCIAVASPA